MLPTIGNVLSSTLINKLTAWFWDCLYLYSVVDLQLNCHSRLPVHRAAACALSLFVPYSLMKLLFFCNFHNVRYDHKTPDNINRITVYESLFFQGLWLHIRVRERTVRCSRICSFKITHASRFTVTI